MTDPNARLQKLIRRLKSPHDLKRIHAGLLLGRMRAEASVAVPLLKPHSPRRAGIVSAGILPCRLSSL